MPQLFIIPLLFVAMYMLVIRPQQQRLRAQQALVSSIQIGDEVISSSGIYGTIADLDDQVAVLRVADGVEIRIARAAIARRVPADDGSDVDEALGSFDTEQPGGDENEDLR